MHKKDKENEKSMANQSWIFPLYTYHTSIKDTEKSAFYLVYSFLG